MLAAGKSVGEVLKVSEATLSRWRSQYGGIKSEENKRLKTLVADLGLDKQILQDVLSKKL